IMFGYKGFFLSYSQNYIDERFLDEANHNSLKGYNIGNFVISKEFKYREYSLTFDFHVNNAWSDTYYVKAFYPMPLRNYQIGVRINFNKNK
ncbi:MAG: hypothetical protein PHD97_05025, partial [Bacteroidales bacterium]|nr:hypothetical protein [Bacteroidales bacterium]